VSPKVLTRTLRRLEEYGFVTRTVFPAVPARVEYELTDLGRGAARPLARLRDWVETHVDFTRPGSGEHLGTVAVVTVRVWRPGSGTARVIPGRGGPRGRRAARRRSA
jgi:hypothetical protein